MQVLSQLQFQPQLRYSCGLIVSSCYHSSLVDTHIPVSEEQRQKLLPLHCGYAIIADLNLASQ